MIPGLPSLPISVVVFASIPPIVGDVLALLTGFSASPWGVFQNGISVIDADSVVSVGYKQDWSIAEFQIEKGGFETYDKVDTPFNSRVRFASGGSQANRQALLDSIAEIAGNLELYDVVTPEQVYTSVNFQSYTVQRSAQNGVGLIQVDVTLLEVRVNATAEFSDTRSPTAQSQTSTGTVQSQPYRGSNLGPLQGQVIR